jgi:glucan phosphorylase
VRDEPGIFATIRETLIERGDYFMHLAGLASYAEAQQELGELYADADAWARRAIINIACRRPASWRLRRSRAWTWAKVSGSLGGGCSPEWISLR